MTIVLFLISSPDIIMKRKNSKVFKKNICCNHVQTIDLEMIMLSSLYAVAMVCSVKQEPVNSSSIPQFHI